MRNRTIDLARPAVILVALCLSATLRSAAQDAPQGEKSFSIGGAFQLTAPEGWLSRQPAHAHRRT